jgi:DNA polymerase-3 subunit epsilon
LSGFIGASAIVAHNASFDLKFLEHECARYRVAAVGERKICTLLLARRVFPGHTVARQRTDARQSPL